MSQKTFEQWVENGWLKRHTTSHQEVAALLRGAEQKLADAEVEALSNDGRFQFAYETILRYAMAALAAEGFRASSQSHHYRTIASLQYTIGATDGEVRVFDSFRRKRNTSVYDAAGQVSDAELEEALQGARDMKARVEAWLRSAHPALLNGDG